MKYKTHPNLKGICTVNGSKDISVLVTPSLTQGHVKIIHFDKAGYNFEISAHKSAISALALNNDGTLLATASANGKVIRIFFTENGTQI
jgi:autophagy-related protein 18